ncbi:ATP-binding protein [Actinomadura monticuli]|uniref:ATP-binding SpoIIE family protein phosphatase n=1 Tax=Actinomadura monticuli TaxID=3097367 RepID=A0ABV4Q6U4_9ACTN
MGALSGAGPAGGPPVGDAVWMRVEEVSAAAGARRRATVLAERLGFGGERLGQIQLAATEMATNLIKHARQGEMMARIARNGGSAELELLSIDRGPGMADVRGSRVDGRSTSGTLGIGLGAIDRLADRIGLHSLPGHGTVMFARFHQPGGVIAPEPPYCGLTRAIDGETECGDAYVARVEDGVVYAMLCDGLGHGPLAARASREAVEAVERMVLPARPVEILRHVHRRLSSTRGGAVAVAAVDPAARKVRFAGLGNVAAWIVGSGRRQGMISVPGIAGAQARTFREHVYDLPAGAAVVLHSDGLTDRWDPGLQPDPSGHDPLLVAAALMRDAGVRHDDRCVVAVAPRDGR